MTHPGWFFAVFAPAVAVAAVAWPLAAVRPHVEGTAVAAPEPSGAAAAVGRAVGQGGCSSVGCHGAPGADAFRNAPGPTTWASSALLWTAADPHRRAYEVLDGDLAKRMMAALSASGGYAKTATEEARCLACHTNPSLAVATDPHAVALRAEGVSCEACHGNAGGWLRPHTGFTPESRAGGYDAGGMTRLYDLGERAAACAGCHVGAPAGNGLPVRDMNHDMVAAGHPRLNFDFATYQFMLPKHWHERDRTKPGTAPDPDFEARAWLVGRVAHAEAACRLTADRATRSDPWPEFAESSCVACHHTPNNNFENSTSRYAVGDSAARRPGSLPWQPIWPVTRPGGLDALGPFPRAAETNSAVTTLLAAMQRPRPAGDAGGAAGKAATELAGLRRHVTGLSGGAAFTVTNLTVNRAVEKIPPAEWDRDLTEQVYLARAALARAELARGRPTVTPDRFAAAARALTLPRGTVRFDLPPGAADAVRSLAN